jgi:hypothetical protein
LKWPIFKQKKGCATISWGLNYSSMGSSQPPSRDTVPLTCQIYMKCNQNLFKKSLEPTSLWSYPVCPIFRQLL